MSVIRKIRRNINKNMCTQMNYLSALQQLWIILNWESLGSEDYINECVSLRNAINLSDLISFPDKIHLTKLIDDILLKRVEMTKRYEIYDE